MSQHWSQSFPGSVPAAYIREYLTECLELIDENRHQDATQKLWEYADSLARLDLAGVPPHVLEATQAAVNSARLLLREHPPKTTAAKEVLVRAREPYEA